MLRNRTAARLKSAWFVLAHERFAKRALKNLRKVGLAAARRRFLCNGTKSLLRLFLLAHSLPVRHGVYVVRRGRRPRRPGRADIESAPTTARQTTFRHRRGALGGHRFGRHPAKPARSCGSCNSISARIVDTPNPARGFEDAAPYRWGMSQVGANIVRP